MSSVKAKCPYCGSEYAVEERHIGVVVKCAKCQKPFQVSPIFASAPKRIGINPKFVKWFLVVVFVVSLVATVIGLYPKKTQKEQREEFIITKADVRHYRHFCEVMQKGDIDESIKAMRAVPPDASPSFKRYMSALADELSSMADLLKQLEGRIERARFAKIWDDDRIIAGAHPDYSMTRILNDSNRVVDELIADLKRKKESRDASSRKVLKQQGLDSEIVTKLYEEIIHVCYMYKGIFKDASNVYDLYRNNKSCWHEECGDVVVTDRNFITKINTAMRTLRESAAALVAHCQSRGRAGMNQAKRAVDQLERGVK